VKPLDQLTIAESALQHPVHVDSALPESAALGGAHGLHGGESARNGNVTGPGAPHATPIDLNEELPAGDLCAGLLLDTVPLVMRTLHEVIHEISDPELTVGQFRTLMFVHRHEGANLSAAAEHLGLRLASTSKLVDHLVRRRLLGRAHDPADRRRMVLRLTARGDALLQEANMLARRRLAGVLNKLEGGDLAILREGLGLLQASFLPAGEWPRGAVATNSLLNRARQL
jgi:DNA-binding MarR family transcriptional regulator